MISPKILFERYGIYIFLAFLLIAAALISPTFLKAQNLKNILYQVAPLAIVSIGQTFVILSGNGGIDLSVASVMMMAVCIASKMMAGESGLVLPVMIICLLFGILVGLANGLLIVKRKIPPVIVTLGMMIVIQGLRYIYTGGTIIYTLPPFVGRLGTGSIGPVPYSIIALAVFTTIAVIILKKTALGRKIYTVGGNINTAKLCGYNVGVTILVVYMISGFMATIGGIFLGGWVGSIDHMLGKGYEIDSIAVVVMGGTTFEGGRGGVLGTIAGVLILMVLYNLIILMHLPIQAQLVVKGAVIVFASYAYVRKKLH